MSTHNICFRREIRKIICGYPLLSVAMVNISWSSIPYKFQMYLHFSVLTSFLHIFVSRLYKSLPREPSISSHVSLYPHCQDGSDRQQSEDISSACRGLLALASLISFSCLLEEMSCTQTSESLHLLCPHISEKDIF